MEGRQPYTQTSSVGNGKTAEQQKHLTIVLPYYDKVAPRYKDICKIDNDAAYKLAPNTSIRVAYTYTANMLSTLKFAAKQGSKGL